MKIQIRDHEKRFTLILPTGLIFSRPVQYLANHTARKYAPEAMKGISPEALDALFTELRRIKKIHGSWELVEVDSADGEYVKIVL